LIDVPKHLSAHQTTMLLFASQLRRSYRAFLVMGCICLGLLILTAAQFAYGVRQSQREGRVW
jgi:gluconate kinase